MICIFEKSTRNSGIIGGKFLEKTRVPKPGSTVENPEYYGPADFSIGATVEGVDQWHDFLGIIALFFFLHMLLFFLLSSTVFGHRFVLTDADRYVLSYLESLPHHVPEQTLSSLRQKFVGSQTSDQDEQHEGKICVCLWFCNYSLSVTYSRSSAKFLWRGNAIFMIKP